MCQRQSQACDLEIFSRELRGERISLSLSLSLSLSYSYLSLSLSRAINQPKHTVKLESKKTHASVTLAGACEVINWRGVRGADHEPAIWYYLQVVSDIKIIFRNKVQLSSR